MTTTLRLSRFVAAAALLGGLGLAHPAHGQEPVPPVGGQPGFRPMGPPMGMPGGMMPGQMMPGGMMPGMMPGPGPAIAAAGDYVYVLRGMTLFQFAAKDMALVRRVEVGPEQPMMRRERRRDGAREAPGIPPRPPLAQAPGGPEAPEEPAAPGAQFGAPDVPVAQVPGGPVGPPQGPGFPPPGGPQGPGFPQAPGMPQGPGFPQPPAMRMPMMAMAPVALTATPQYVYVLRGNVVLQFSSKDLKLVKRTPLPLERPRIEGAGRPMQPGMPGPGGGPGVPPPGEPGPGEPE